MLTDKEKYIILIDNEKLKKSDIIVLLEGDGYNRIQHTMDLLKGGRGKKIIISGGAENKIYGSFHGKKLYKKLLSLGVNKKDIILELESLNTREQAINVIHICKEMNFKRIILVGSHYHQYRAFLTFLRVLTEQHLQRKLQIYNSPANDLPRFSDNLRGKRINILENEFERIKKYKKHMASFKDVLEYQKRKEKTK